ncbi:retrovirus-related pol polyprotein from transposon TNT 1-94 [Tanacetum coccineum]
MDHATTTKFWLWHQRLSHLNFDPINDLVKDNLVTHLPQFKYTKDYLCPSCEQGKSKKAPHKPKPVPNSKNRSKDEAPKVIKTFLKKIQVILQALVIILRTDNNDREDIGKLGGQPLDSTRTAPAAPATHNLQTLNASTTTIESAPTPTNSSSQAYAIPNTSHDVNELQQQHSQQQND